jgi:hypothetical protein
MDNKAGKRPMGMTTHQIEVMMVLNQGGISKMKKRAQKYC